MQIPIYTHVMQFLAGLPGYVSRHADKIKTCTEIAKNSVEALGFVGSFFILYQWVAGRRDHSTQVLFDLEKQFICDDISMARSLVEDDAQYAKLRKLLIEEIVPEEIVPEESVTPGSEAAPNRDRFDVAFDCSSPLRRLDALLRFYVFIYGIRRARQVKDSALSACYRFYLAHYYSPSRRELLLYIHNYYPTLRRWLLHDRTWWRRIRGTFFTPEQFGWHPEQGLTSAHLKRSLNGRILVIVGAGLSADSGLKTFRSGDGYWEENDPRTLATQHAFDTDRQRVWNWYIDRRKKIRAKEVSHNAGHLTLAKLARTANDCLIVTQNVDDLHERAGTDPKRLIHIHGDIFVNRCGTCGHQDRQEVSVENPPLCPMDSADGYLRPGVVWYDEDLDVAHERQIEQFLRRGECDLVLVIGTSASFGYIIDWALTAVGSKGILVEINTADTILSPAANVRIRRRAVQALPELLDRAIAERSSRAPASSERSATRP